MALDISVMKLLSIRDVMPLDLPMIFALINLKYPEAVIWKLSLTACEKSDCFAVSMFDERVFPYSPPGGSRCFERHLRSPLLTPCFVRRYVVLRNAL